MEEDEILHTPSLITQKRNKWKLAFQSILILIIGLILTMFLQKYIPHIFCNYAAIIFALYFFIKRINYEGTNIGERFLWSTFIIFTSYLIFNSIYSVFFSDRITDSVLSFIFFNLGALFRSCIFGITLSLGVFHLIKNKNWAMLFLMILMSLMFQGILGSTPWLFAD